MEKRLKTTNLLRSKECWSFKRNNATSTSRFGSSIKMQKKLDSGYAESEEEAKTKKFFEPMLALNYDDRKAEVQYPIYSQPKLDGIRCIVRMEGDELVARSRKGKVIDAVPHILSSLKVCLQTIQTLFLMENSTITN